MRIRQSQSSRAFTRVDLAVILGVLALLAVLLLSALSAAKAHAASMNCINHLKKIGLAFRIWSSDNDYNFPWLVSTNVIGTNSPGTMELVSRMAPEVHFRAISNELGTAKILHCPADSKREWTTNWNLFSRNNLSYFVNLDANETKPKTVLIGDRNLTVNDNPVKPGLALLTTNQILGWSRGLHKKYGHIVFSDGSAQIVDVENLNIQFQASSLPTNRLVIPGLPQSS